MALNFISNYKKTSRRGLRALIVCLMILVAPQSFVGLSGFAQEMPRPAPQINPESIPAPKPVVPKPVIPETETPPHDESGLDDTQSTTVEPDVFVPPKPNKDLTVRSEAGRQLMLAELFEALKTAPDPEAAELKAEEIWAVFLQSQSASIDFTLLRGISAHTNKNYALARRLYDHVLRLQPEFAEGWSRSGRLAYDQGDLNQAVDHITQSLKIEPRHFFALWTLGNILEKLERPNEAFEAYSEAYKLYPEHAEIKARVEALEKASIGQAL